MHSNTEKKISETLSKALIFQFNLRGSLFVDGKKYFKEIKNQKKIVISKFEKIKQRVKEENYDSITFSDILNNYNENKFDLKLTISKEKDFNFHPRLGLIHS
ncbi:hypothetical protein IH785_04035 [candidate division KSB1 bacterium]|nr:hypothetical protein [candidate division KSB1 bacterium]